MLEVIAGIWLFLLTAGAGFAAGRYSRKEEKPARRSKPQPAAQDFGWQQLLNFLQYDGSGMPLPKQSGERMDGGSETHYDTGTDTERIRPRHSL